MFALICTTAFVASMLTFFSGFGLGTVLLPVFAIFFPLPFAIAMTAVVHFTNNILKVTLVGRHARKDVLIRFGIPAVLFSFLGAWILMRTTGFGWITRYTLGEYNFEITWVKLLIATVIFFFTLVELFPIEKFFRIQSKHLPLGGALSGFFGGLSGHQGALRSMFLVTLNLSKESFIGTGVVIALLIDIARIGIYSSSLMQTEWMSHWPLLLAAIGSAFAGTWLGNRYLKKITMDLVQKIVAACLLLFSIALGAGLL
ncbi:MAG: sulfite exporter TauE/SafE family protein [Bdellovibrionota bacterium]